MLDYKSIRARYELAVRDALYLLDVRTSLRQRARAPIPEGGSIEEYATIEPSASRHPRSLTSVVALYRFVGIASNKYVRPENGRDVAIGADGSCCSLRS